MPLSADALFRALPDPLARLVPLALDLHWSWNHSGDAVWKHIDETLWNRTQNPWLLLQHVPFERLETLAGDAGFLREVDALEESRRRYHATPCWRPGPTTVLPRVAYFSMEFGLDEALPLYAGGLGILAGDFLKTASDLGVPVVGVGILWQQGYFRQVLDAEGRQAELYPFNEPLSLPVRPVFTPEGGHLRISLGFQGRTVLLRTWQVTIGRTMLYLLDSNDPCNEPADRGLTSALYGGGSEVRFLQDMILGVGGWRLLEALGLEVDICHLNEGHGAFAAIERARCFMQQHATTFREALWATRAGNVFTTHTAVAAGFDRFPASEFECYRFYFEEYFRHAGLSWSEFLALGRANPDDPDEPFNMAYLALRASSWINAVSDLHGRVSRRLFASVFPGWPEQQVPVDHVTNGVHMPSWDSPSIDALWTRIAGQDRWRGDVSVLTAQISGVSDKDLWSVRAEERRDLVRYARERLQRRLARHRGMDAAAFAVRQVLDSDVLTLGFARRFASYKRPNLLLSDPERLLRLLTNASRPVQLIVAGKAHPRDDEGKRFIQQWARFAAGSEARPHVVFLDDYDLRLATELVRGVDVWINTPRRPWEACGTSGMKVLVNGGLNLSTLDGWWAEAFGAEYGWALGDDIEQPDDDVQEAAQLYSLLENEVVPSFYDRDADGFPRGWIARMRASMANLAPRFSSVRMLQDYVERAYVPAASLLRGRSEDDCLPRELEQWSRHLKQHWSDIHFGEPIAHAAEGWLTMRVVVDLGGIDRCSVRVQLYADAEAGGKPVVQPMEPTEPIANVANAFVYSACFETGRPAQHFTARVVPSHRHARVPLEMPLICWQR